MTIPTLMSKHQKHTQVVALKKAYATLTNAIQTLPISRGCPSGDYLCSGFIHIDSNNQALYSNEATRILAENIKGKLYSNCKEIIPRLGENQECIITDDGMAVYIYHNGIIAVDTNGNKGPNIVNRDIWGFSLRGTYPVTEGSFGRIKTSAILELQGARYDTTYPLGLACKDNQPYSESRDYEKANPWNAYCTNYVIATGKIDY